MLIGMKHMLAGGCNQGLLKHPGSDRKTQGFVLKGKLKHMFLRLSLVASLSTHVYKLVSESAEASGK